MYLTSKLLWPHCYIPYPVVSLYRSLCIGSNLLYKNFYCHCTHSQGLYREIWRALNICNHYLLGGVNVLHEGSWEISECVILLCDEGKTDTQVSLLSFLVGPLNWVSHGQSVVMSDAFNQKCLFFPPHRFPSACSASTSSAPPNCAASQAQTEACWERPLASGQAPSTGRWGRGHHHSFDYIEWRWICIC